MTDEQTYYTEGKDAPWFDNASDKDFAVACLDASMDLADSDISELEKYMPIVAIVSSAADRIERLRRQTPELNRRTFMNLSSDLAQLTEDNDRLRFFSKLQSGAMVIISIALTASWLI